MAAFINRTWGHLLDWDSGGLLHPHRLRKCAKALHDFGALSRSVFGFIDCTIRPTCCPGEFQELGMVIPNGLIGHLLCPYRAPAGVLAESKLLEYLETHAIQPGSMENDHPARRYFQVYSDSAYGVSPVMVSPYLGVVPPTPEQCHCFGLVLQDWPQLNCFWQQRIWGTQCGVMYRVGVLLTNAFRYGCDPPTLEEYFHAG
ncbi:hypothetical protein K439DRAFT_1646144 [Ramaria rubella]|nr:hypothetical protein K439DRAFT_1646144 [Ramaria rubella]